jgi:hypothetical protein
MLSGNISAVFNKKITTEISLNSLNNAEKNGKSENAKKTKRHKSRSKTNLMSGALSMNGSNFTNSSFNISMRSKIESQMNFSKFSHQNTNNFFHSHNSFLANKLLDKQIIEIFNIFRTKKFVASRYDLRSAVEFFLNDFEKCSPNKTYVMDLKQFQHCMTIDPSLNRIIPPSNVYANYLNYSDPKDSNHTSFKTLVFNSLNRMNENYLNFYDYLMLRLYVFSWWKCSVNGPYLDETGFECAIDIVNDWRSMDRQTSRNIYYLAIKLAPNAEKTRHIDFINFINLATSIRTYGSINQKEDSDATIAEFNNALDNNILPIRYNQKVIDDFFKLVCDEDNPNQGIDIQTFWYFDAILKIFFNDSKSEKRWQANFEQFSTALDSGFFPSHFQKYIQLIPQFTLKNSSYMMEVYDNIKFFKTEEDHLMLPKFLQKSSKMLTTKALNAEKTKALSKEKLRCLLQTSAEFDKNATYSKLFTVLDADEDGFVDFNDFGIFVQVVTLFAEADLQNRGRVVAGVLLEKFSETSGLPTLNSKFREKAKRFGLINQDTNFDVLNALIIMKMDDIAFHYARKEDPSLLMEIELKQIYQRTGLINIPDGHITGCVRGPVGYESKKYDWECAVMVALKETVDFIERASDLTKIKSNNIELGMSTYKNVDASLQ